jgi:hypothetical protein
MPRMLKTEFVWLFNTLKYYFIDYIRVVLRRPEGRLWLLRAIRLHKKSLRQLLQSPFFRWPECRKLVRIAFRHLQTSLHRHYQSRILRHPEIILRVLRAIQLLKLDLSDFVQIAFVDAQNAENDLAWPFEKLKHRFVDFSKVVFSRPEGSSQAHLPT